MNIALIGPTGVGKGTHVAGLVQAFHLAHLSTGDLFRQNLEQRTALGILARRYMDAGELVPDEVVDAMIEERVAALAQDILFDGFPRTVHQARFLDELFKGLGRQLEAVVYLRVGEEQILERLAGRRICRRCHTPFHVVFHPPKLAGRCDVCGGELDRRPDDDPERVRARLRVFQRVTGPLADYCQGSGRLMIVEGEGPVERVHAGIVEALEAVRARRSRGATAAELATLGLPKPGAVPALPRGARPSLDVVLLGGPGCGKGTQAEGLTRQLGLLHVATGELFRENLKQNTELGRLAKTYMDRGELVPDDLTEAMVQQRLAQPDAATGFVLDGFPRTLAQAGALTEMLVGLGRRLAGVLYLSVPDEQIVKRLAGRLICRACQAPYHVQFKPPTHSGVCDLCGGTLYQRDDDNPQTVRARLKTFHAQTEPLIAFYRQADLLVEVDADSDVPTVSARTLVACRALADQLTPAARAQG